MSPDASGDTLDWNPHAPEERTPENWLRWGNQLGFCQALGIVCTELGDGKLTATVESAPVMANPNGSIHGGMQLAIADHCLGMVAATRMQPGFLPASTSVHGTFHRPAMPPITIRGRVLSAGRTLVHAEVELFDERGRLCTSSYGAMAAVDAKAVTRNSST